MKGRIRKLNEFLEEYDIEPTELHYNIEMSWINYQQKYKDRDIGKLYDRWFKENTEWIKPIIVEVAKRDYKIKIK